MTRSRPEADDTEVPSLDTGFVPHGPSVADDERNLTMTDQGNATARPPWQAPFFSGLVGVGVGAAIGAGTGMWWMMGVLGGAFAGFGTMASRRGR